MNQKKEWKVKVNNITIIKDCEKQNKTKSMIQEMIYVPHQEQLVYDKYDDVLLLFHMWKLFAKIQILWSEEMDVGLLVKTSFCGEWNLEFGSNTTEKFEISRGEAEWNFKFFCGVWKPNSKFHSPQKDVYY